MRMRLSSSVFSSSTRPESVLKTRSAMRELEVETESSILGKARRDGQ
jgi:hypothetical protein